jgi:hypothetical protein
MYQFGVCCCCGRHVLLQPDCPICGTVQDDTDAELDSLFADGDREELLEWESH